MVTADEWLSMSQGARTAVRYWLRTGGVLHVYTDRDEISLDGLGIPAPKGSTKADISFGGAEIIRWENETLRPANTVSRYGQFAKNRRKLERLASDYTSGWNLQKELGTRAFRSWQIILTLIVFGILVGPVNLFVFAKPGKRHRLFFTTPLISFGTTVFLLILIFFQDGSGGEGRRFVFVELRDDERTAYVFQEQISRTGVLFGNGFSLDQPSFITPVVMARSPWVTLSRRNDRQGLSFSSGRDLRLAGDWFRSRSEQGHYAEALVATRARLERSPGEGTPTVLSSLEHRVDQILYIDDDGAAWQCANKVETGELATFKQITDNQFKTALGAMIATASKKLQNDIRHLADQPNSFFAFVGGAAPINVSTLSSIDWMNDTTVIHGRVINPPPAP